MILKGRNHDDVLRALFDIIEGTLATIEYMSGLKRASKSEFARQINMAQKAISEVNIEVFNYVRGPVLGHNSCRPTRFIEVMEEYHGSVSLWAKGLENEG